MKKGNSGTERTPTKTVARYYHEPLPTAKRAALVVLAAVAILGMAAGSSGAAAGETTRVSVDSSEDQGNNFSFSPSTSANGRFVAFTSIATDLVEGDTNGSWDVFVRDRKKGTTERVSVDGSGDQGNAESSDPSISPDGRFVSFSSDATDLVEGDTNDSTDVFVRDRKSGTTERVSVDATGDEGDSNSFGPSTSGDGRFIAFESDTSDLVAGDGNGSRDVFVRDRQEGTTELASVGATGDEGDSDSFSAFVSPDGRFVAFASIASDLVEGDTNGSWDVFVRDRKKGTTERVSVDGSGDEGNDFSSNPSISANGRFVAFESDATDLATRDTNDSADIFVYDRKKGTTERASVDGSGGQANASSGFASISSDGRFVAFNSDASNLVKGDKNGSTDVFARDRKKAEIELASVNDSGDEGDSFSFAPSMSGDGRFVAFESFASNLVKRDTNNAADAFVHELDVAAT